jgi:hypothetical protein
MMTLAWVGSLDREGRRQETAARNLCRKQFPLFAAARNFGKHSWRSHRPMVSPTHDARRTPLMA